MISCVRIFVKRRNTKAFGALNFFHIHVAKTQGYQLSEESQIFDTALLILHDLRWQQDLNM